MRLTTTALAATAAALTMAAPASAAAKPDLVVSAIAPQASSASPNASFDVAVTVRNAGRRVARKSTLRLVASSDRRASKDDAVLASARTASLKPRKRVKLGRPVALPGAGTVFLIACADSARKVKESSERNNCRVSSAFTVAAAPAFTEPVAPVTVAPEPEVQPAPEPEPEPVVEPKPEPTPEPEPIAPDPVVVDSDGDKTPDDKDCDKDDPQVYPGAPDGVDSKFVDDNCDGVDGVAGKAIFVAPGGDDSAAGTREAPLATVNAAIKKAPSLSRNAVMVQAGTYIGTVTLAKGISLYGGYTSTWGRTAAATTTILATSVTGGNRIVALDAIGINATTRVQRFKLQTADAPKAGVNLYGVRAVNSPSLKLEDNTIVTGSGAIGTSGAVVPAGLSAVDQGAGGNPGACDDTTVWANGGAGGTSPVGRNGGNGGRGGDEKDGLAGAGAVAWIAGFGTGGPGGKAGNPGTTGQPGKPGKNGADGTGGGPGGTGTVDAGQGLWTIETAPDGTDGEHGIGGGGGGGGGGQLTSIGWNGTGNGGGGGGAAGGGGGGGNGGQGGSSSFGVFVVSSDGMTLTANTIKTGGGGAGGGGSMGGEAGLGTDGGQGANGCTVEVGGGGDGGKGGNGGKGGRGGGGAGGSSIGVYRHASPNITMTDNVITPGFAGSGSSPNGLDGKSLDVF